MIQSEAEIQAILLTHEVVNLTNFYNDRVKDVDFLLISIIIGEVSFCMFYSPIILDGYITETKVVK